MGLTDDTFENGLRMTEGMKVNRSWTVERVLIRLSKEFSRSSSGKGSMRISLIRNIKRCHERIRYDLRKDRIRTGHTPWSGRSFLSNIIKEDRQTYV